MPTITAVKDPVYSRPDNNAIDCIITTEEFGDIPFTATPGDLEPHGREIYQDLIHGKYGTIAPYTPPAPPPIKIPAQALLNATDLTMARIAEAVSLGLNDWANADVVAWVEYRRVLREIVRTNTGTIPARPAFPAGT